MRTHWPSTISSFLLGSLNNRLQTRPWPARRPDHTRSLSGVGPLNITRSPWHNSVLYCLFDEKFLYYTARSMSSRRLASCQQLVLYCSLNEQSWTRSQLNRSILLVRWAVLVLYCCSMSSSRLTDRLVLYCSSHEQSWTRSQLSIILLVRWKVLVLYCSFNEQSSTCIMSTCIILLVEWTVVDSQPT
jgi:hypothetical protein